MSQITTSSMPSIRAYPTSFSAISNEWVSMAILAREQSVIPTCLFSPCSRLNSTRSLRNLLTSAILSRRIRSPMALICFFTLSNASSAPNVLSFHFSLFFSKLVINLAIGSMPRRAVFSISRLRRSRGYDSYSSEVYLFIRRALKAFMMRMP